MGTNPLILVTGGTGFIGSNIAGHFARHADVVVCDRPHKNRAWRYLADHKITAEILPEQVDDFLSANRGTIDTIIHMGAISSTTERDINLMMRNNYLLTRHLWDWCSENGTRFIYASSAATYGQGETGFGDELSVEALLRLQPLNLYGWSKHLFDLHVARTLEQNGPRPPQWAGLKFFNVYGPNEYHKGSMMSVVAQFIPKVLRGETVKLFRSHHPDYEDGGQKRDFIYVDDCVRVIDWLYRNKEVNGLFNLGTGKARTFGDLARAIFTALEQEPRIEYIDTPVEIRSQYQYFTQAEMARLAGAGFKEGFTELEDGVADYVRRYPRSLEEDRTTGARSSVETRSAHERP